MKQILILLFLSFTLCCNLSAYDIFNFNTTKNGKFLTGTGADVICTTSVLLLSDNPIESATYHAGVSVISQGSVAANSTVNFKAGQTIFLLPGFHVVSDGAFSAKIEECPNSFEENLTEEEVAESRNQNLTTVPFANKQELSVYPNPFSYTTTVDFQLFEDQKVHLAIYSATQQLIKVLAPNKIMAKGNYKYEFSGADLVGGMYFVVLRTEETNLTKKLILVK